MTLRSCGRETVPMMGPRSRGLAAPQLIGKRGLAPGAGCEVRRMWSARFTPVIRDPRKTKAPPVQTGTRARWLCLRPPTPRPKEPSRPRPPIIVPPAAEANLGSAAASPAPPSLGGRQTMAGLAPAQQQERGEGGGDDTQGHR